MRAAAWAKLSPNTSDLLSVAAAALEAGAESLTLTNTLLGLAIDTERRAPVLGAGGGGLSGEALHSVALRAVYDCRAAFPNCGIVGVGGVRDGEGAVRMLLAGADAVQVGTASLADPRAVVGCRPSSAPGVTGTRCAVSASSSGRRTRVGKEDHAP